MVEIARKRVGISVVIVATFYTMLMLLSHGMGLQTSQRQTADFVIENFSSRENCAASLAPKLCAFSTKDVQSYEATYYLSYVGVGMLAMYASFLLFIRRVEQGGGGDGGRYSFKSTGVGRHGGGGEGMSTRMDEYQVGGASGGDGASPWRENEAYA